MLEERSLCSVIYANLTTFILIAVSKLIRSSRFKLHTPDGHYSVPPNVDVGTVEKKLKISTGKQKLDSSEANNDGEWQEIRCT